jgi:hypothetical protein
VLIPPVKLIRRPAMLQQDILDILASQQPPAALELGRPQRAAERA